MDSITSHPEVLAVIVALPLFGVLARLFGASLLRIAKWYLYIAVFAVVVVMNSMFFPFIGGKDYFFRFTVELSLIFFIFAWALEAKAGEIEAQIKALFKKPLVLAVSAFAFIFLLACIFAYDVHAAFWSNYERGEGGFQMIHYYLFFLLLTLLLKTETDWKNIFRFSLVAAGLMILYGIGGSLMMSNFIGPWAGAATVPTSWLHKLIDTRFQGSLGNAAYVGAYLLFAMFFAAYLWIRRKVSAAHDTLVQVGYGVLIAIFLLFFLLSQTRGAFLGLGVSVFVLAFYFTIAGRGNFRKWSAAALIVVAILGGTVFALRHSSTVQSLPGGRLLDINFSATDVQTRFWVWGAAWQGFLERPILGWGPENFTTVFDAHFNPNFFIPGQNTETWFDRAHSVYFDYLSETGILGLLAYLSIFAAFFYEFGKRRAKSGEAPRDGSHLLERGLILSMPIAYLVQGIAIFDVLPMYLVLFMFFAFSTYYFYEKHGQNH